MLGQFVAKLTLLAVMISNPAVYAQTPSHEQLVSQAFDDYAKVAGGWFINKRCGFIAGEELKSYESSISTITVALGKDLGNPKMLFLIQQSAQKTSSSEKYRACDDKAKEIVTLTSTHAKNWATQIEKLKGP